MIAKPPLEIDSAEAFTVQAALAGCGSVSRLRFRIDLDRLRSELVPFESSWRHYNSLKPLNRREGLSVTSLDGGFDGKNLESLREYRKVDGQVLSELDFRAPTAVYESCGSLREILNFFSPLGRSHFLRLRAGGHFPPHRDLEPSAFRVIIPCFGCSENDWTFQLDGRRLAMEAACAYYVNTRLVHSVFSFSEDCMILVINVPANRENCRKLLHSFSPI